MVYLPHWPIPSSFGNQKLDFETVFLRLSQVLARLDNPHKKLPPTIHVTGTNGKGSTCAFLAEILRQSNLKVDLYTSPHLHNCNERIVINDSAISDSYLYEILEETRIAAANTPLTFFESFTIATFLALSRSNSDICIIETGMGARIDATNIIEKKISTIITPISFDHEQYLGETIEKIAFEKSFIIRPETPLIIAPQPSQAQKIIELFARDQNAKMIRYDREFEIFLDEENNSFDFKTSNLEFLNLPKPSLRGQHQYINAATAIACATNLPLKINENAIKKALEKTFWPSRIEKVENNLVNFFTPQSEIYIDGAHNVSGAFALAKWIVEEKNNDKNNSVTKKNFIIAGFSKNKCRENFLLNFRNIADEIIAIRVDGEPNPEDSQIICEIGKKCEIKINPQNDLLDAIYYLSKTAGNNPARIIICGSLHLARDVRKFGKIKLNN